MIHNAPIFSVFIKRLMTKLVKFCCKIAPSFGMIQSLQWYCTCGTFPPSAWVTPPAVELPLMKWSNDVCKTGNSIQNQHCYGKIRWKCNILWIVMKICGEVHNFTCYIIHFTSNLVLGKYKQFKSKTIKLK